MIEEIKIKNRVNLFDFKVIIQNKDILSRMFINKLNRILSQKQLQLGTPYTI